MDRQIKFRPVQDQTIGASIAYINQQRVDELLQAFDQIRECESAKLNYQDFAFKEALEHVNNVRNFLGSPEHILGNKDTKHGEIAEHIEVEIRNAKRVLEQLEPNATFEGVGRTAPEDYLIDGIPIQSKFINGIPNNLDHILRHMAKYEAFGRDESYYVIPHCSYDVIQKLISGESVEGLSEKKIKTIYGKIQEIESYSGKNFTEAVRPSISQYNEVQQGVVFNTVDGHEESLIDRNEELVEGIKGSTVQACIEAKEEHSPNFEEAGTACVAGIAIGSLLSTGVFLYSKKKNGKKIHDYDKNDWEELGINFNKGALKGGVSGAGLYGLTNYTDMCAPLAGSFVSSAFGVASLTNKYKNGVITLHEFSEQGQTICFDAAAIAIGATAFQAMIPIPMLGAFIGSFASRIFLTQTKKYLAEESLILQQKFDQEFEEHLKELDTAYRTFLKEIQDEYDKLGTITKMAFDFDKNALFRFNSSINLCVAHKVPKSKILYNINDIDKFMVK